MFTGESLSNVKGRTWERRSDRLSDTCGVVVAVRRSVRGDYDVTKSSLHPSCMVPSVLTTKINIPACLLAAYCPKL